MRLVFIALLASGGCAVSRSATGVVVSDPLGPPGGLASAIDVYAPSGAAAANYVSGPPPSIADPAPLADAKEDPLRIAFLGEVAHAAREGGQEVPQHDVRLDRAADDIARYGRQAELPSFETMNFFLYHYGIVEPEPASLFERGSPGAEALVIEDLRRQLPEFLRTGAWSRVGVGIDRTATGFVALLMLQERHVDLESLPRALAPGGGARVRGQLRGRLQGAQMFVTLPGGGVQSLTVAQDRGRFQSHFWCGAGNGRYQLEILGTDERGPRIVANFPMYCGVVPPRTPPRPAPADAQAALVAGSAQTQPGAAEQALLGLINVDRKAAGIAELSWDNRLADVARGHSRDMALHDFVGHVSPTAGSFGDRLARFGLAPQLVLENVSLAFSIADVHNGLMSSPGHRANIIDPRATHIGIGVVLGKGQDGRVPLLVTEIFATGF